MIEIVSWLLLSSALAGFALGMLVAVPLAFAVATLRWRVVELEGMLWLWERMARNGPTTTEKDG